MSYWMMNASTRLVILTLAISVILVSPNVHADQHEIVACEVNEEPDAEHGRIIITGLTDPDTNEIFHTAPRPYMDPDKTPDNHWHKAPTWIKRAVCAVYNRHRFLLKFCNTISSVAVEIARATAETCGIPLSDVEVQTCADVVSISIEWLEEFCQEAKNAN